MRRRSFGLAIEDMKSCIAWLTLFFLLLQFANSIEARKDPGEYWSNVMKDQPIPEALQGLVHLDSSLSPLNKNANCHTSMGARNKDQLVEDFEHKNAKKNFEPRPNYVEYAKDGVGHEIDKKFVRNFEPRPNHVEYSKEGVGHETEKKFEREPRPNYLEYSKDGVGLETVKKFVRDFELSLNDDDGPKEERPYVKEFEATRL